ncbi:MAG: hypothetical protein DRH56_05430 [Deltaproteobacteria bacterium]|nr:MAG: hypothetical protein DRH56_05430 [Deltaproteobacteria bacterium]
MKEGLEDGDKGRKRLADEFSQASSPASGLQERLPQKKELPLDLPFTLQPEELPVDHQVLEDVFPERHHVRLAEIEIFDGKDVQGCLHICFGEKKRHRHPLFPPFPDRFKGPVKIVDAGFGKDDHEIDVGFSRDVVPPRGASVKDDADKIVAENPLVIGDNAGEQFFWIVGSSCHGQKPPPAPPPPLMPPPNPPKPPLNPPKPPPPYRDP